MKTQEEAINFWRRRIEALDEAVKKNKLDRAALLERRRKAVKALATVETELGAYPEIAMEMGE